ncbi:MAG: dockerin type I repeat-containing protein [Ruminococcus sp.]|nr:dockerin type I repeat-containing protein [Ruminococcus sp.]
MKKILSFVLTLTILFAMCVVCVQADSVSNTDAEEVTATYDEAVLRGIIADYITARRDDVKLFDSTYDEIEYTVVYSHCTLEGATPDYVLVDVDFRSNCNPEFGVQLGDYIITNDAWYRFNPFFVLGYFVVIPETSEVLMLEQAYNRQIEGFECIFTETDIARRIGDADNDRSVNIKDATYIQKILAEFEGYEKDYYQLNAYVMKYYYADFNGDFDVNIKDATDIQKYIAGLEYSYRYDEVIFSSVPDSAKPVNFTEENVMYMGDNPYKHSYNKLITSASEYNSFFLQSSDVYNEEFFETKSLVYIYRCYSTGMITYQVNSVYAENDVIYINSRENHPNPDSMVTCDIGVYEKFIVVDKSECGDVSKLVIDERFVYYD